MVIKYLAEDHEKFKMNYRWEKSYFQWHYVPFENKSAIIRNITEPDLLKASPHWPNIGRFIGWVTDIDNNIDKPWQENRVYQDELDEFNNPLYQAKQLLNGMEMKIITKKEYYELKGNK